MEHKANITKTTTSVELISIEEIPLPYRNIFSSYPCFNSIQSAVFHNIIYTDRSIALSAPTGCGKTVIFELAIVKHLLSLDNSSYQNVFKIVYIAPVKALCEERLIDWHKKFSPFGLNCISVTGDSDYVDFDSLINHSIIITTPEKWDTLTRKWKENIKLIQLVKLILIDEIHLLNEDNRGATLEVLVCRMKAIETYVINDSTDMLYNKKVRFMAASATFPNIEDLAEWFGGSQKALHFNFPPSQRPVKLNTYIFGYPCSVRNSPFKFDLSLNYKLPSLIMNHSKGKPTLIFCSTRKMVEMTASYLKQALAIPLNPQQKSKLLEVTSMMGDSKIKSFVNNGIGYHHGGLLPEERHAIENLFRESGLPVLITTSTLAMGVNLPAHLVIIKSTKCYDNGSFRDYTATALMQMLGRAGRPQFDSEATAIILTLNSDKEKFSKLLTGSEPVESKLHQHLTEHLNAEIVLNTISHLDMAMNWLSSTYLYIRARKNPRHYNLSLGLSTEQINKKLLEVCQIDLNKLVKEKMAEIDEDANIRPTFIGKLMAKFYLSYETMKQFKKLTGKECLQHMLNFISSCHEFSQMRLRVDEKKCLNLLNKSKDQATIRFPLKGKIKTLEMKINCIIQAVFGCLELSESSILTETFKVLRHGEKICKCLIEYLQVRNDCYTTVLSTIILGKCFQSQIWENSPYISKQLPGIGLVTAKLLVNAGMTTFDHLIRSNPRTIEMIIKKKPPAGSKIIEMVTNIPRYGLQIYKDSIGNQEISLNVTISLINSNLKTPTLSLNSVMCLLVGDNLNNILLYERYMHSYMIENPCVKKNIIIDTKNVKLEEIYINFVSEDFVGIDCSTKYFVRDPPVSNTVSTESSKKTAQKTDGIKKSAGDSKNNGKFKELDKTYHNMIQTYVDQFMKCKKSNSTTKEDIESNKKSKLQTNTKDEKILIHENVVLKHSNNSCYEDRFLAPNTEKEVKNNTSSIARNDDLNFDDLLSSQALELLNFPNPNGNAADKQDSVKVDDEQDKSNFLNEDQSIFDNLEGFDLDKLISEYIDLPKNTSPKIKDSNDSQNLKKFQLEEFNDHNNNSSSLKIKNETHPKFFYENLSQLEDIKNKYELQEGTGSKTLDYKSAIQNFTDCLNPPKNKSKKTNPKLHSAKSFENSLFQYSKNDKSSIDFDQFKYQSKKLNHKDPSEYSEYQKPYNPTTLFSTSTRKRKITSDKLDDEVMSNLNFYIENEKGIGNNSKSLTWRSPLVFSPNQKFSPKITSTTMDNSGQSNEQSFFSEKSASPVQKLKLPVSTNFNEQNFKRRKIGAQFPLSDEAYEISSSKMKNESFASNVSEKDISFEMNSSRSRRSKDAPKAFNAPSVANYYCNLVKKYPSASECQSRKPFYLKEMTQSCPRSPNFSFKNEGGRNSRGDQSLKNEYYDSASDENLYIQTDHLNDKENRLPYQNYTDILPINNFNFGNNHQNYINKPAPLFPNQGNFHVQRNHYDFYNPNFNYPMFNPRSTNQSFFSQSVPNNLRQVPLNGPPYGYLGNNTPYIHNPGYVPSERRFFEPPEMEYRNYKEPFVQSQFPVFIPDSFPSQNYGLSSPNREYLEPNKGDGHNDFFLKNFNVQENGFDMNQLNMSRNKQLPDDYDEMVNQMAQSR